MKNKAGTTKLPAQWFCDCLAVRRWFEKRPGYLQGREISPSMHPNLISVRMLLMKTDVLSQTYEQPNGSPGWLWM